MKKRIVAIIGNAAFLLLLSSFTFMEYAHKKPDFSGTWKLNESMSELNEEFSFAPVQITITQEKNMLTAERKSIFQGNEYTMASKYTLDGKESKNKGFQDMEYVSVAQWSDDGKSLVIKATFPMQDGGEMKSDDTYMIVEKQLTVKHHLNSSYGDVTEKWVFDKVEE